MIKKFILFFLLIFAYACSFNPQSGTTDSGINSADRHIWIPSDEDELENRRVLQLRFDEIESKIEALFLKIDSLNSNEITMREGAKKVLPDIATMDTTLSAMINKEKDRVGELGKNIETVNSKKKILKSEADLLDRTIKPDPVFMPKDYINAFIHFRKGHYAKSSSLFRKTLKSNPPYALTDNILFGLGMSNYRLGNISKVSSPLSRLISEYPESEKWYMSHLILGLSFYHKREKSQALHILESGLKKNPPHFIRSMFINLTQTIQK